MKKLFLVIAAVITLTSAANARTTENTLFTCDGILHKEVGGYEIREAREATDDYDQVCIQEILPPEVCPPAPAGYSHCTVCSQRVAGVARKRSCQTSRVGHATAPPFKLRL
jgi:hypothetical protein